MPARNNYKAQFGLAIKLTLPRLILNNSTIWLVNTKAQNKQMHCQISPRRNMQPMWLYNENEFFYL